MTKHKLSVQKRHILGRATNSLRVKGLLPTNIYGQQTDSVATQISLKEFHKLYSETGETNLIYITIEGEDQERPCLISNVQYHPTTDEILHADFRQVNLKEKVTAEIPVETEGDSPAVINENATIVIQHPTLEVTSLPTNLPEKFLVDISTLVKVGDVYRISDLKYDREHITIELDIETILASAQAQQAEEVIEVAPASEVPTDQETPADSPEVLPAEKDAKPKE